MFFFANHCADTEKMEFDRIAQRKKYYPKNQWFSFVQAKKSTKTMYNDKAMVINCSIGYIIGNGKNARKHVTCIWHGIALPI